MRFEQTNFSAPCVAIFLRMLMRHLRGHVVVVWDQGNIHKGPFIQEIKRRYPRLHIEYFPGYSPDLNPVEYVWGDFKGHDANGLPLTKKDIRRNLHADARRVRRSQRKLRSFVLASELPSPPW